MTKPAFGLPPINFSGYKEKRSDKLWGPISKSLLDPLSEGETMPYVQKVHEARFSLMKRISLQEFAMVNNLAIAENGVPTQADY